MNLSIKVPMRSRRPVAGMRFRFWRACLLLVAGSAQFVGMAAHGAAISWNTSVPGDGFWLDGSRWVGGVRPADNADVVLPAGGYRVTVDGPDLVRVGLLTLSSAGLVLPGSRMAVQSVFVGEGSVEVSNNGHLGGGSFRNGGSLLVDGPGSDVVFDSYRGSQDLSVLTVRAGADASFSSGFDTGSGNWSVMVDGNSVLRADSFVMRAGGGASVGHGAELRGRTLSLADGHLGLTQEAALKLSESVKVSGGAELRGSGYIWSPQVSVIDGGTLVIPNGQTTTFGPTLFVGGDLACRDGILRVGIGGTGSDQTGLLKVSGALDLSSCRVLFEFFDGFLPDANDTFDFLEFGSLSLGGLGPHTFGVVGASGQLDVRLVGTGLQFVALTDFSLPLPGTAGLSLLALLAMAGISVQRNAEGHRVPARARLKVTSMQRPAQARV